MTILESQADLSAAIQAVAEAGYQLRVAGVDVQSQLLERLASQLEAAQDEILEANTLDLEASLDMAVPELVLDWLKLTPERLHIVSRILRRLAALGDPRRFNVLPLNRLTKTVTGYSQVVPLGVIAFVYEALPELAVIMAGFCLRTGNGLILKGGNEASQTHQVLLQVLHRCLDHLNLSPASILSLAEDQGDAARSWLLQSQGVDLVIPYGRPSLVKQVVRQATVPVLPTAMGNCYLYWSASGSLDKVTQMVLDSHRGDPDAVNAIEKVLIPTHCSVSAVAQLCNVLWDNGFDLLGDEPMVAELPDLKLAQPTDWDQPFLSKTVALARVDGLTAAAHWMNRHSSGHANSLVTEVYQEVGQFTRLVNSAVVYINTSPRFVRNGPQADAIALGMTAQQGRCQGFIGLQALLTNQHILQGFD
ncbi:MAG TPA: aldehyde dehydrogenase family protein [Leptolyngbyaceae cyanobacterium M65_K2018_010]|nr:aldehyde dehydrogenase family protein [Leptolyngbyaceae cyanobacterium M65_K2018_010]